MRGRAVIAFVVVAYVAATGLSGCGGGEQRPIRIALMNACYGTFGAAFDAQIGAAELPLIERAARLAGSKPSDGLVGAEVAGRKVELLFGCKGEGAPSSRGEAETSPQELLEVRRLVEREHADVLIGSPIAIAVREYAKQRPQVAFVTTSAHYQSTALRDPAPNLLSIFPDLAMQTAGLGAYAYTELGWRRAVTIDADINLGWATTAGFVAAFCALGGEIAKRIWVHPVDGGANPKAVAAKVPKRRIDGIYWGAGDVSVLLELGRSHPLLEGDLGRKIVGHWYNLRVEAEFLKAFGERLDGVADEPGTLNESNPAYARYARLYTKTFPGQSAFFGLYAGQYHYTAMEAVLRALERVDGDLSDGSRGLLAALAETDIDAPPGRLRLDQRRQAIGPVYVARGKWNPNTNTLGNFETLTYRDVDQTFGGYFTPDSSPPSRTSPPCKKLAHPPVWMRNGG